MESIKKDIERIDKKVADDIVDFFTGVVDKSVVSGDTENGENWVSAKYLVPSNSEDDRGGWLLVNIPNTDFDSKWRVEVTSAVQNEATSLHMVVTRDNECIISRYNGETDEYLDNQHALAALSYFQGLEAELITDPN
ncbi:hypothetical protein KA025_00350 [Candidatus Saccharibacteria bacterium]|nr:hypothetical protein [Candidatus Saccharibacteria bacterium]MBP7834522.1 hypothetical protein [Candidatus Saccharibacteria bacterium]